MSLENNQVVSAQVILPSASGKVIGAETIITSENIGEYAPAPELVARASAAFAEMGFEVGAMVGVSMSITAPVSTFERVFNTRLYSDESGGIKAVHEDGTATDVIPLDNLPEAVAALVAAVTFVPPPDFGPTDFFGP